MGARRDDITSASRAQIALTMLDPHRPYGTVTALAAEHNLSRQALYTLAAQARELLHRGLVPLPHGPRHDPTLLCVDPNRLRRAVLTLTLAGLSQRDVVAALEELLDQPISLGSVNNIIATLEQRAQALNASWQPNCAEGLAADELFANDLPHLLIVGNDSLFIYALQQHAERDATTWGCMLLDAPDAAQVGTDGGSGLAAGLREAGRDNQQLDWDHLLRSLWVLVHERERSAYAALRELQEREALFNKTSSPKRLAQHLELWERDKAKAEAAMAEYDALYPLVRAVDSEFAMIDVASGELRDAAQSAARLQALGQQLRSLGRRRAEVAGTSLTNWAAGLVSYLPRLAAALEPLVARWGAGVLREMQRIWQVEANQRRGRLGVIEQLRHNRLWQQSVSAAHELLGEGLLECWGEVRAVLGRIWRGSNAAECINSLYRALLRGRKHSDQGIAELFSFMHNTHRFTRGKRAGQSPAELVGLELPSDPLTLLGLQPKLSI